MRLVSDNDAMKIYRMADERGWPGGARAALLAMETVGFNRIERRAAPRARYRRTAEFLPTDMGAARASGCVLYTRDVNAWTLGFLTADRLMIGARGAVTAPLPDGATRTFPCTIRRCRELLPGWFEGVLHFAFEQPLLHAAAVREFAEPVRHERW